MSAAARFAVVKAALFVLSLAPVGFFTAAILGGGVAEPVAFLTRETGEQALRFLLITLAMTPLRLASGWSGFIKLRRMFGLFAFFYALCHFGVYVFLDLQLDFAAVVDDIIRRKYITVGFAALVLLLPLALTSNSWSIKRLGARKWSKLHRAVYVIALLAPIHFLWQERGEDLTEPLVYLGLMIALLALRVPLLANRMTLLRRG